jgi:hypothetical protein
MAAWDQAAKAVVLADAAIDATAGVAAHSPIPTWAAGAATVRFATPCLK